MCIKIVNMTKLGKTSSLYLLSRDFFQYMKLSLASHTLYHCEKDRGCGLRDYMKLTVSGRAWVGYEGTVGHFSRKRQLVKTKSTSRSPNSAAERKWQCGNLRLRVLSTSRVDVGDKGKAPLMSTRRSSEPG